MKTKRILAYILLFVLIFNTTIVFAEDGLINNGRSLGHTDGYIYVLSNYSYGNNIPNLTNFPTRTAIESKYSSTLLGKTVAYKAEFYAEYIQGYLDGYEEGRAILVGYGGELPGTDVKVNYGTSLGQSIGEIYGYRDYYNDLKTNWAKAIPSNSKIITLFDLNRETAQYRSKFINDFREAFKLAYEEAFEFALLNVKDTIIGSAIADGKELGNTLGSIYGEKDYFEGKTNNYKRDLPTDASIIKDYTLNRFLDDYKIGFLNGFKLGYEEGYNEAYYNSYKEAIESGTNAGRIKGELMATKDYIENKTMSWSRHKSLLSAIENEYRLIYLSNAYRGSFLNGFWTGFAESYEEAYKSLINEKLNEKIAFATIPIAGGMLVSGDNSISVEIQSGTFYNDITLSIEKVFNNKYRADESRYIKTSDIYNIQLSNHSKNLDNSKPITISMEYYGKDNGGIYKWVNGKWSYINSIVKNGRIEAIINPNTLRSGDNLYCILIDKNYVILTDVRSHWAKDKIETLVRRNIITGYTDKTFKPDRNISRAEFLALLSRMYSWSLPNNTDNIKLFNDYPSYKDMEKVISYAISSGYIKGYEDNTFRPNQNISYKEVEIIMGRVLQDPSFKWYNTSAKMLYEEQVKSRSYSSMNNRITRAEVAYMLYILNEWRY
ncbi:MAG: S-layer homology domain-containing protein [Tissierellaceae bacterium]|nr:S-layer homology domain-containing protein [Tissierellaceae bacterium]